MWGSGTWWADGEVAGQRVGGCRALSDALDVVASLASWRELPRLTRWLVLGSAGAPAARRAHRR
jgi:hypothetical protein